MRLDLEEYDFTVEYLKGKDNHIADALSRITITDLKNIQTNNKFLTVTTRNQSKQKNSCAGKEKEKIDLPRQTLNKASQPNVFEVIVNDEVRKVVTLRITDSLCLLKHGKQVIARIDVNDMYTNGLLDLGQFFQRLEKETVIFNISKLKVAPSEKIFDTISIEPCKIMGNKILQSLRVALLKPVTLLSNNDKEKEALLFTFHDDPIQGGHTGIARTLAKIKRHYYWKNMTRLKTSYIRKLPKCQKSKTTKKKNTNDYF